MALLNRRCWAAALGLILTAGSAAAEPTAGGPKVALSRMVTDLPAGTTYAVMQGGFFCRTVKTMVWNGGQSPMKIDSFQAPFRAEMEKAGFHVAGDPTNLFDTAPSTGSDYSLAARVVGEDVKLCQPNAAAAGVKGHVEFSLEWQLYSNALGKVVTTARTSGSADTTDPDAGNLPKMMIGAMAANVDQLVQDAAFRKALSGPVEALGSVVTPDGENRIALHAPLAAMPVKEAPGSVVVVFTAAGTGSGVLVSSDGYVLTAAHVVGDAKTVRLKWSDGLQTTGEVVRTSQARDVALIKTDGRGRTPLRISRTPVEAGQVVYAVGAPLGEQFQGSVTRGVVSGNRVIEGFSYIQSDTPVAPGNSGGPLLDEQGRVVGLTRGQIMAGGQRLQLGLFIPARDAADFLALDLR